MPTTRSSAEDGLGGLHLADYPWSDDAWLEKRATEDSLNRPISIYEVHLARGGASRKRTTAT
jgi:1,4-alpha-glucan branching enzyme